MADKRYARHDGLAPDVQRCEHKPPVAARAPGNPFTPSNPAFADVTYFDSILSCAYGNGVGSLTLATRRQLLDASGQSYEDLVIAALVRAPMFALRNLKHFIEELERLEAEQAAATAAAMKKPPRETAH